MSGTAELTDAQRAAARACGLSDEEYVKFGGNDPRVAAAAEQAAAEKGGANELTAAERACAESFGMTAEEYAAYKSPQPVLPVDEGKDGGGASA